MDRSASLRRLAPLALLAAALVLPALAPRPAAEADSKWLARLDKLDRTLLTELVGNAPPAFTGDLTWVGSQPLSWKELRGRVVVLQSWTGSSAMGRGTHDRVGRLFADAEPTDVIVIGVHTPEGADKAGRYMENKPSRQPVVIDTKGVFCDAVGFYKKPANVIVDRNGTVRYVGLNSRGLTESVAQLVAETHDPLKAPSPAGTSPDDIEAAAAERPSFPPFAGSVGRASDLRGKQGPEIVVSEWITAAPRLDGKVVVIDFWATWCGPCVRSIPHMNELARKYQGKVEVIGVSHEKPADFERGMQRLANRRITVDSFQYALALDEYRKIGSRVKNQTIPHAIVMSTDGIVRWQGHPGGLDAKVLGQIVEADGGIGTGADAEMGRRKRWTR